MPLIRRVTCSTIARWAAVIVIVLCGVGGAAAAGKRLVGNRHAVSVIDGDTIQVDGHIVQLAGIDAPELGQLCVHDDRAWPCGLHAAFALNKLIELATAPVVCTELSEGLTGLVEASCEIGHQDLSLVMLQSGYAVALPKAAAYYQNAQAGARKAHLGIWGSHFIMPWAWRKGDRLPGEMGKGDTTCVIRGKVTDGARLYYVPTDPAYDHITVVPSHGDRTFCSDEEARATGWRRPGQDPSPVHQLTR